MRRIAVTDETDLPFPPSEVWRAITDFEASPNWWRPQVKVVIREALPELVGSTMEVRPFGGMAFVCRVSAVEPMKTMTIQYIDGVYRGNGIWALTPTESGTRLSYAIDLEVRSRLLVLLSYLLNFGRIHSRLMKQVFANLERFIAQAG